MEQQIAVNWLSVFFGLQYTSAGALLSILQSPEPASESPFFDLLFMH